MSENHSTIEEDTIPDLLISVDKSVHQVGQLFAFIYTLVGVYWLVYVIRLFLQLRSKKKSINSPNHSIDNDYLHRIFTLREMTVRNCIFLVFICCELIYSLTVNIYGNLIIFMTYENTSIPIGHNCTVDIWTVIGAGYSTKLGIILLNICANIDSLSFSMMIWLFGVSLFHLSFAAKNKLRVKAIILYILLGFIIYLVLMIFVLIPYTSLFGSIAQSVMDQISLLIAFYIATKRFIPAMKSRVIDAFHYNNYRAFLEQKRLLKKYKVIIWYFLFIFEIFVLKDLIFYSVYAVLESISTNSCWFHATYHLPLFHIVGSVQYKLIQISDCFLVLTHLTNIFVYANILLVNLTLIYIINQIYIKRMLCWENKNKYRYRYPVLSSPLLHSTN